MKEEALSGFLFPGWSGQSPLSAICFSMTGTYPSGARLWAVHRFSMVVAGFFPVPGVAFLGGRRRIMLYHDIFRRTVERLPPAAHKEAYAMTYQEILANARTCMGPYCKSCPVCNGVACKNTVPGPGAKGIGTGFIRNYRSGRSCA